jgi:hypothetical protein
MKERIKSYLEFKLDLELCGVSTFEKDDDRDWETQPYSSGIV